MTSRLDCRCRIPLKKTGAGFQDLKTRALTGSKSVVTQQVMALCIFYNVYHLIWSGVIQYNTMIQFPSDSTNIHSEECLALWLHKIHTLTWWIKSEVSERWRERTQHWVREQSTRLNTGWVGALYFSAQSLSNKLRVEYSPACNLMNLDIMTIMPLVPETGPIIILVTPYSTSPHIQSSPVLQ